MMGMTLPAWLSFAALANQFRWATKENYDQFMASKPGQNLQSVAIALSAIFAAFRAGKAFTEGSYVDMVPSVVYGATAFFAWSGKSAAKRVLGTDRLVDRAVTDLQVHRDGLSDINAQLLKEKASLQEALKKVVDLENANAGLVDELRVCKEDADALRRSVDESNAAALKAKTVFEKVKTERDHLREENAALEQQLTALRTQNVLLSKRVQDLSSSKKSV